MSEATSRNLKAPKQNSAQRIRDHLAVNPDAPDDALAECRLGDLRALAAASETQPTDAEEAKRYRRLKDASGRTWDKLAGAHITGQLDVAIDHLGDDE